MEDNKRLLQAVDIYYSEKIRTFGVSARGVDWNSEASQELRFEVLSKVLLEDTGFSILDYGCGYGALLSFLTKKFSEFKYTGFDISEEMLKKAVEANVTAANSKWISALSTELFDYTIASGIFNVKLNENDSTWLSYIEQTLDEINNKSLKGFSFNMLTKYSDSDYMKPNLYYADPSYFFRYCKEKFSKYVSILHDYPLYEFTIVVRKEI